MGLNMGKRPEYFAPLFGLMEELIEKGVVDPGSPAEHDLSEVATVLSRLEQRQTAGKHVFVPGAQATRDA